MGIASAGRRRQGARRVDRAGRADARPLAGRHPPLRALQRQRELAAGPHQGSARPALQDAVAATASSKAPVRSAARRCTRTCATRGACFGSKMGWERANFFAPTPAEAKIEYGWGHQNWHPWVAEEHRACRERVAVFDMSSFAKLLVKGRTPHALLDRLVANVVRRPSRPHGLHRHAERARRLRERLHDHLPRRRRVHGRHRQRAGGARPRRDRARTGARRTCAARSSTSPRCTR